jgi:hypothetical protein
LILEAAVILISDQPGIAVDNFDQDSLDRVAAGVKCLREAAFGFEFGLKLSLTTSLLSVLPIDAGRTG